MIAGLVAEIRFHGFRIDVTDHGPRLVRTVPGSVLPAYLLAELKQKRREILSFIATGSECELCRVCKRDVTDPETRERMADPLFCQQAGAPTVTDGQGVVHEGGARCPYKPK